MPAYNSELYIREAIESVFAQTLPVAEFIVIDDGSTDQTARIVESMGVRVIRQSNTGLSGARNRCVLESSQPWIAFIDADDIWDPKKIERQMEILKAHPDVGLITTDYLTFNSQGTIVPSVLRKYHDEYRAQPKGSVNGAAIIDEPDAGFANIFYFLVPSAVVVRHDLLVAKGGFEANLNCAEDFECFMRIIAQTPMAVIEQVLVRRREHEHSASNQRVRSTLDCLAVTYKVLEHPERYPSATVELCKQWLPANLRHAAARQLWAGNAKAARELLIKSARLQLSMRTVLALVASLAPARIGRDLMTARYYLSRRLGI